jgi:hypothetical protein
MRRLFSRIVISNKNRQEFLKVIYLAAARAFRGRFQERDTNQEKIISRFLISQPQHQLQSATDLLQSLPVEGFDALRQELLIQREQLGNVDDRVFGQAGTAGFSLWIG